VIRRFLAWGLLALAAAPAQAWNATGHRVIAAIAYDRLSRAARARVDGLIRSHPDYAAWVAGAPADPRARARAAFIAASVWADEIRSDPRFYDETNPKAARTPLLAGYPDMGRHTTWHYVDIPFSSDGTPVKEQPEPHALSELRRLREAVGRPAAGSSPYALVWLLHIAGDVHQPLHCVARFSAAHPDGDAGGNYVYVRPGGNLHAFWDQALGTDRSAENVNRLARQLRSPGRAASADVSLWIQEGYSLARSQVYIFGSSSGSREAPLALSRDYVANARRIARTQVSRAGFDLAALLNGVPD
jgi:hypothetical protein